MAPDLSLPSTHPRCFDHRNDRISTINRWWRASSVTLDLHNHCRYHYHHTYSSSHDASAYFSAPSLRPTYCARARYFSDAILARVLRCTGFVSRYFLGLWETVESGRCCVRGVWEVQKCVAKRSGSSSIFCS